MSFSFTRRFPFFCLSFFLCACQPNYFLNHPLEPVAGNCRETEFFDRGGLRVHWVARYANGARRLPAVLIHPDRGSLAADMEGICLALARLGYFAAAVDYQRLENLRMRNPLIPFGSEADALASLDHLRRHPRVDPQRIALLGYSKGAILSLQIASLAPDLKGVVAYYPLADFDEWRDEMRHSFLRRIFFSYLEWRYNNSGPGEKKPKPWGKSPIDLVEKIRAPVLLVHGEKDRTFPVTQSRRLCERFRSAGEDCELFVVAGAGHVFNFLDGREGQMAWDKTINFLDRHVARIGP